MAGQTLTLTIASQLQSAGFTEAAEHMKAMQADLDKTREKSGMLKEAIAELRPMMAAVASVEFLKGAVDEAIKASDSMTHLQASVEAVGGSWNKSGEKIKSYTEYLGKSTRFETYQLNEALAVMIRRTGDESVALSNFTIAMGIAAKTGIDLTDAATKVGMAANGINLTRVAKEFGLSRAAMNDAGEAMKELSQKYAHQAEQENSAVAGVLRQENAWKEFKETLGTTLLPVVEVIGKALMTVVHSAQMVVDSLVGLVFLTGQVESGLIHGFGGIKEAWKNFKDVMSADASQYGAIWGGVVGKGKSPEDFGKDAGRITAEARTMSKELIDILKHLQEETAKAQAAEITNSIARLRAETEAYKKEIRERADFKLLYQSDKNKIMAAIDAEERAKEATIRAEADKKLTEQTQKNLAEAKALRDTNGKDKLSQLQAELNKEKSLLMQSDDWQLADKKQQDAALLALDEKYNAQREKDQEESLQKTYTTWLNTAGKIGQVIGDSNKDAKDKFKSAAEDIIDIVVQEAQTLIVAYYAEGAAKAAASAPNWVAAIAAAAPYLAEGAIAAAAVGSAGSLAKSAIEGGGSTSGGGSAGSTAAAETTSTTTSGAALSSTSSGSTSSGTTVNLHVYGDFVGDDAYVSVLAQRLSDMVANRDVRLLATQVNR